MVYDAIMWFNLQYEPIVHSTPENVEVNIDIPICGIIAFFFFFQQFHIRQLSKAQEFKQKSDLEKIYFK